MKTALSASVRVLVVDDEQITAEAHAEYISRVEGFELTGVADTGEKALALIDQAGPDGLDLVLLDMNLPDMHGLDVCRALRANSSAVDVIAVTAARELHVVQTAVSVGIMQYLIKPFTFPAFRAKLESYSSYRSRLQANDDMTQSELDGAFAALRTPNAADLPKGLSRPTLDTVLQAMREKGALSAAELAELIGVSRVTARRYLEQLADGEKLIRAPRYGTAGRPELEYRWPES
ncbi:response regulator [Saxibacter everestensis]|uniref:Transcriptional regulatory protein n=1 Tax=Saxibacter everestensis TaxID=2909229 RepID=A0ABY8QU88_9MICO|nr:response regulator [Brevibacteriaceae bacterium ZFBP1038]